MQVLHVIVKYLQENNRSREEQGKENSHRRCKRKFSASFLQTVAAKHVSQVISGGYNVIFLAIKRVHLVLFFPIISLYKLTWWLSPISNLRTFIKISAARMCPNYHFSYGQKTKKNINWEERQICKEIGTGGLRGWCDTVFLVLLQILCSLTNWPPLYGWNQLSSWKTNLVICRKLYLWWRMTEVVIDVAQFSCCYFKTSCVLLTKELR